MQKKELCLKIFSVIKKLYQNNKVKKFHDEI